MNKKTVRDIDVKGKKVLVRCDFNVPQDENGNITDNRRIVSALDTIKYLIENNAKVILCSHLGRPKGEVKKELSLAPIAKEISRLLGKEVKLAEDIVGESAKTLSNNMKEGEVILKKYSPIGELSEFATGYAETLSKTTGHIACITDKDTVIAVSGGSKKEFLEQDLSKELEHKEVYTSQDNNEISIPVTRNDNKERKFNAQVIYPIISQGDAIGSVILLSKDPKTKMGEAELKVVQSAAGFLGNQMEI